MLKLGDALRFSASDLVGHVDCHHLTDLDARVAHGTLITEEFTYSGRAVRSYCAHAIR
jgi:hypothetical protein